MLKKLSEFICKTLNALCTSRKQKALSVAIEEIDDLTLAFAVLLGKEICFKSIDFDAGWGKFHLDGMLHVFKFQKFAILEHRDYQLSFAGELYYVYFGNQNRIAVIKGITNSYSKSWTGTSAEDRSLEHFV